MTSVDETALPVHHSGTFDLAGSEVHRLGYGAMQITGPGVWGPHRDQAEAIRVLKRLPELGINFIDTADSYGPDVSEQLIREALHPYGGLLIATKVRNYPNTIRQLFKGGTGRFFSITQLKLTPGIREGLDTIGEVSFNDFAATICFFKYLFLVNVLHGF